VTAPIDVRVVIPTEVLETLAELIAVRVKEMPTSTPTPTSTVTASPYMSVREAAEYLCCSRQRVDDLLSSPRLTRIKEGRAVASRGQLDPGGGGD
jgi:hypothetical protein